MRINIKNSCAVLLLMVGMLLKAQQSMLLNHTAYDLLLLSPAAAILPDQLTVNCHFKKNWTGMPGSPETTRLNVCGPSGNKKMGLGAVFGGESAGIFLKQSVSGIFSYKVPLSSKQFLAFGLGAGFRRQSVNFSALNADAPEEFYNWPQQQSSILPDASFGFLYAFKKLYITAAANQVFASAFEYQDPHLEQTIRFKTLSDYVISVQKTFDLHGGNWRVLINGILRSTQGLPVQPDVYGGFEIKDRVLFGAGFRTPLSMYGNIGLRLNENIRLIYGYEYSRGFSYVARGGHGISLQIGFHQQKKGPVQNNADAGAMEEIFAKLDQQEAEMEKLKTRSDSLDKNLMLLRQELEALQNKQLSKDDIIAAIDQYFERAEHNQTRQTEKPSSAESSKKPNHEKYRIISPKTEADFDAPEDSLPAGYKLVFGVYQLATYAKQYQRLLKREAGFETTLIQLPDHPRKYIYVCMAKDFDSLLEALSSLKTLRQQLKLNNPPLTKGEAWILQTIK